MSNVDKDIKNAINIIKTNKLFVDRFQKIYPFATENVYGCFSNYNFKDKECLTVLGSSSQMLYMYLNGAKEVTTFDINRLSVYYYYFIKAFLLSKINKEDLISIFTVKSNKRIISKIIRKLDGDAYIFWKTLYNKYGVKLFTDIKLFHEVDVPTIYHTSGYLEDDSIKELRKIIGKIEPNFINCNVKELPNNLHQKYDLIYLSNIIEYSDNLELFGDISQNKVAALIKYKQLIIELSNYLTEEGLLYGGYIYEPNRYYIHEPLYNNTRKRIFPKEEFKYHIFKGYNDVECEVKARIKRLETDACLIYPNKNN